MANAVAAVNPYGWLRSPSFDLTFIFGTAFLAIGAGVVVVTEPHWFYFVLFLDLWLLGYQHVVATFTRLTFDRQSFQENKFLVVGLPWIVFAGTIALGYFIGLWALATIYLYWQWFHYTRQSYGIMRFYSRKSGEATTSDGRLTTWALYLLPLWGILYRSYQRPPEFLGMEVKYIPTNEYMVYGVGAVALGVLAYWLAQQVVAWRQGRLPVALTLYMLSHFTIFFVGYVAIDDITFGWLVINVWHNTQYILIVWMYNTNRFKNGIDQKHRLLSAISQTRVLNTIAYFLVSLLVTTVFYGIIALVLQMEAFAAIPLAAIIIYQTINFHHYIVDGLIWKRKRRKVKTLVEAAT